MIKEFKQILRMTTIPVCLLLAGTALASDCTPLPNCSDLGYTKSATDCPEGGVKCPFDTNKMFCESVVDTCEGIFGFVVPANAFCESSATQCPSVCLSWNCKTGYTKSGDGKSCKLTLLDPGPIFPKKCSTGMKELMCGGKNYCCANETTCEQLQTAEDKGIFMCLSTDIDSRDPIINK